MPRKQHTKQFKLDAINYRKEHPDLTQLQCAKNLGIGISTLARWESQYRNNDGDIPVIGSGNHESDEQREIARLKRELRDTQDALDVLKKSHRHSGKRLTKAILTEVAAKVEASKVTKHRVSVSGMLKVLGVSRSGYRAFLKRKLSATAKRKNSIKKEILKIYNDSKQNYGAPKITKLLQKSGETISQRTVGKYIREMGIRAQWSKPWIATTKNSDFSSELHNILNEQFNPERPNAVWCTDITYIWTNDGFVYLNCVMDLFARKTLTSSFSFRYRKSLSNVQMRSYQFELVIYLCPY